MSYLEDVYLNNLIDKCIKDDRILGMYFCGSRASSKVRIDKYSDYDIVWIVDDIISFLKS